MVDYKQQAQPLVVEGLVVKYGSFVAVDNISFTVKPGEIYGLLGPNGAGKTSTLKVIIGLLELPDFIRNFSKSERPYISNLVPRFLSCLFPFGRILFKMAR